MNKETKRNTAFLGLSLLAIAAGVFAGLSFYKSKQPATETPVRSPLEAMAPALSPPQKMADIPIGSDTLYHVSPASTGSLSQEKTVDLHIQENQTAIITMPEKDSAYLAAGDYVLPMNSKGENIEAIGEIITIGKPLGLQSRDTVDVIIAFSAPDKTVLDQIEKGKIYSQDKSATVARLPAESIVKDKDGTEYVWELVKDNNGTATIKKTPAGVTFRSEFYVVMTPVFGGTNIYILNPDKNLREDRRIFYDKSKPFNPVYKTPAGDMAEKVYAAVKEKQKVELEDYTLTQPGGYTQAAPPQPSPGDEQTGNAAEASPPASPCSGGAEECTVWTPPQGSVQLPAPMPDPLPVH